MNNNRKLLNYKLAAWLAGGGVTFILGRPALFRDCVEDEAEMTPEPLAELRSLPNDSDEPRPDVDDMDPDPEPEDMELCLGLLWL